MESQREKRIQLQKNTHEEKKCRMQSNLCDYSKETEMNVEKNLKGRRQSDQTKGGEYYSNLECNLFVNLLLQVFKEQLPLT